MNIKFLTIEEMQNIMSGEGSALLKCPGCFKEDVYRCPHVFSNPTIKCKHCGQENLTWFEWRIVNENVGYVIWAQIGAVWVKMETIFWPFSIGRARIRAKEIAVELAGCCVDQEHSPKAAVYIFSNMYILKEGCHPTSGAVRNWIV